MQGVKTLLLTEGDEASCSFALYFSSVLGERLKTQIVIQALSHLGGQLLDFLDFRGLVVDMIPCNVRLVRTDRSLSRRVPFLELVGLVNLVREHLVALFDCLGTLFKIIPVDVDGYLITHVFDHLTAPFRRAVALPFGVLDLLGR